MSRWKFSGELSRQIFLPDDTPLLAGWKMLKVSSLLNLVSQMSIQLIIEYLALYIDIHIHTHTQTQTQTYTCMYMWGGYDS